MVRFHYLVFIGLIPVWVYVQFYMDEALQVWLEAQGPLTLPCLNLLTENFSIRYSMRSRALGLIVKTLPYKTFATLLSKLFSAIIKCIDKKFKIHLSKIVLLCNRRIKRLETIRNCFEIVLMNQLLTSCLQFP